MKPTNNQQTSLPAQQTSNNNQQPQNNILQKLKGAATYMAVAVAIAATAGWLSNFVYHLLMGSLSFSITVPVVAALLASAVIACTITIVGAKLLIGAFRGIKNLFTGGNKNQPPPSDQPR